VIASVPAGRDVVLNVATPLPFSVPVPNVAEASMKVTVPVGVLPDFAATVAVRVTF
jgi:hypothetical protein